MSLYFETVFTNVAFLIVSFFPITVCLGFFCHSLYSGGKFPKFANSHEINLRRHVETLSVRFLDCLQQHKLLLARRSIYNNIEKICSQLPFKSELKCLFRVSKTITDFEFQFQSARRTGSHKNLITSIIYTRREFDDKNCVQKEREETDGPGATKRFATLLFSQRREEMNRGLKSKMCVYSLSDPCLLALFLSLRQLLR